MNESITAKLDDIRTYFSDVGKLKIDFESQLTDKDRLYQIFVSELQENKMHWSVKIDEKSKEMHNYRRTIERSREEIKKLKVENQFLRERTREVEEDESSPYLS